MATSMFMTNGMLLWLTLDGAPLRLVIKPKVVKEALQWRSERRAQVQANRTDKRIECNYLTLI